MKKEQYCQINIEITTIIGEIKKEYHNFGENRDYIIKKINVHKNVNICSILV